MASFDRSLPMLMHRTLDCVMPAFRELFARYNLTEQQWRVLRVLWEDEKITSAELSSRTLLPAPSLVGIIDRLEKKQFVARVRSVEDRRIVYVVATAKGRSLGEEVAPFVEAIHAELRSIVSDDEWETMESVMNKISAHAKQNPLPDAGIASVKTGT